MIITAVLETVTFKVIEKHFYLYDTIKKAVAEERENQLDGGRTEENGGGHGSNVSDTTGNMAVKLADPIRRVEINGQTIKRPEDWLKIVAVTETYYRHSLIGELLYRRYHAGETQVKTCMEMCIDRSTYYDWRNTAITYASLACCQAGLIKVY